LGPKTMRFAMNLNNAPHSGGGTLTPVRSETTVFLKKKADIKKEPPNEAPPCRHGPKPHCPLRQVLDGSNAASCASLNGCPCFAHPLTPSVGRIPQTPLRSASRAPILDKPLQNVLDGLILPPCGVKMGLKKARAPCAACRTRPANPPARYAMPLHI